MRVFSLFVAFVFSTAGISALAATDAISTDDDRNVVAINDGNTSVISDEISERDLYSDISINDSLNTEDKGEDEEEGEDGEGESKLSYMFAEVDVESVKGDQAADTDQAKEETTTSQQVQVEQPDEEAVKDDKPSRWSLYTEFWNEGLLEKGNWGTFMTIRPQYQLNDTLRLGYSFEFNIQWPLLGPAKETTEVVMGDHYLMLGTSTALGPVDLFGYVRFYLPTSKATMAGGQIVRVRIKPYFALPVSRDIKFVLRLETNYFQQTVDSDRTAKDQTTCNSPQYCSDINEQWRIEPMLGFLGKIHGPFGFESIHGFRFRTRFQNNTIDVENRKPKHEVMWYNESGIMWDINVGGTPVTLIAGFYDERKTGGSFLKRLPIVSYFTGPHNESYWLFSILVSI